MRRSTSKPLNFYDLSACERTWRKTMRVTMYDPASSIWPSCAGGRTRELGENGGGDREFRHVTPPVSISGRSTTGARVSFASNEP